MDVPYLHAFSPTQHCIIVGVTSFIAAIYLNRLFIWCLYPTVFFLTRKLISTLEHQDALWDSSWFLYIVIIVGRLQRYFNLKNTHCKTNAKSAQGATGTADSVINDVDSQSGIILEYLKRDFISSWFDPISDDNSCVHSLQQTLFKVKNAFYSRLKELDKHSSLQASIELYQHHLKAFQEAEVTLKIQPKYRLKKDREKEFKKMKTVEDVFLLHHSKHIAFQSEDDELEYLNRYVQICFIHLLDPALYDCHPGRELVESIIAASVLKPFMELLSQPFWLHIAIIKLTSDDEVLALEKNCDNKLNRGQNTSVTDESIDLDLHSTSSFENANLLPDNTILSPHNDTLPEFDAFCSGGDTPLFSLDGTSIASNSSKLSDDTLSLLSGDDITVEEAEDACSHVDTVFEQPEQLFSKVCITNTQKVREPSGSGFYVIYNIEYEAWYRTEDDTWTLCKGIARRRYREFITLHQRLQDHPQLKGMLKGIKGPGKWFNLPFGNKSFATVEKRQEDLQEYLQSVHRVAALSNSMALREFLAYSGDIAIAFVRKPSDLHVFDQVFVKTMKRVSTLFDKLNPMAVDSPRLPASHTAPHLTALVSPWRHDPNALQIAYDTTPVESCSAIHSMKAVISLFDQYQQLLMDQSDSESLGNPFHDALENSFIKPRSLVERSTVDRACPLAASLLDLALQSVDGHECWVRQQRTVSLFKVLMGRFLEVTELEAALTPRALHTLPGAVDCDTVAGLPRFSLNFVRTELEEALTPERCTHYLELVTAALWPGGRLDPTSLSPTQQQRQQARDQARSSLANFFPSFVPVVVGRETFEHSIDQVMASLDHQLINKHFAYCLLDAMTQQLFPDLSSPVTQQQLLVTADEHLKVNTHDSDSE